MAAVNKLLIVPTLEPPWAPASPVDETEHPACTEALRSPHNSCEEGTPPVLTAYTPCSCDKNDRVETGGCSLSLRSCRVLNKI